MKDGEATEKAPAPSDAPPPAEAGGTVVQLVAEAKKPADESARQKEADRARRRRLLDKLKGAKDAEQLKKLMRQLGAGDEGEAQALAESDAPHVQLEPGQRPGWPPPSEVAQWEAALGDTLASASELIVPLVHAGVAQGLLEPQTIKVAEAICATLGGTEGEGKEKHLVAGPAGERLAKAWAPIAARYAPALLASPWFGAVGGTVAAGVIIGSAVAEAIGEAAPAAEGKAAA